MLGDKIIALRKKSGWTQEDLAEQLNVSRQSVSKWEGGQSIPDVEKIIQMSQIFDVSIDYLLKEEYSETQEKVEVDFNEKPLRTISLEEANDYLDKSESAGGKIAFGVFLCILSPFLLMLSLANRTAIWFLISEAFTLSIAIVVLLVMVASAVGLFITGGKQLEAYEFLETEIFETKYGVTDMVNKRKREYERSHTRLMVIGVMCCILAVLPIVVSSILVGTEGIVFLGVALTLILVAIGVYIIIETEMKWSSYEKLLQEGEYSRSKKASRGFLEPIAGVYWLIVVAGYLGYSFLTNDWERSWIIYPVAGVLFGIIAIISETINKNKLDN
ncbi:helix-turn-helix domain-containing protein [Enterococcus alcedinis]|uniref:Transcriptional regulator n=1 Tax=Enterococcus alcedinis TaxID=1274384 RepID=A0A917N5Y0_9ENTE|nr:helix-turn-helix transcriptional regulator [Enterococcus alcedinis]MBP2101410.1 transcriptional regulator with XRE-family HTH domain [Enterococcus alcedinis]GGI65197.1 transcriptional regulator [Enterococcus alcedinis]